MSIVTALTEKLGIEVPVIQSGMQWVAYAELSSAVSNAGGLGILTGLSHPTPDDLRNEIRKCHTMTKKPFGVNITVLPSINPPDYEAYGRVIIEEGVNIVETTGSRPDNIIKLLKSANMTVIHKCTTIRHALSAQRLGVDFISINGFEAAGHIGDGDITNLILLRRAAQSLSVPFVASGGFADGQGLASALALGACGINMGTRFMCTVESPIHPCIKDAITKSSESDTELLMRKWNNTNRVFKNAVAEEAKLIETQQPGSVFQNVQHLVSGQRGKLVFRTGKINEGVWTAGSVLGVIEDVPSCDSLLRRIEHDAVATIARIDGLVRTKTRL